MAVGGNTATAFRKEPNQAIQYVELDEDGYQVDLNFNTRDENWQVVSTTNYTYRSLTRSYYNDNIGVVNSIYQRDRITNESKRYNQSATPLQFYSFTKLYFYDGMYPTSLALNQIVNYHEIGTNINGSARITINDKVATLNLNHLYSMEEEWGEDYEIWPFNKVISNDTYWNNIELDDNMFLDAEDEEDSLNPTSQVINYQDSTEMEGNIDIYDESLKIPTAYEEHPTKILIVQEINVVVTKTTLNTNDWILNDGASGSVANMTISYITSTGSTPPSTPTTSNYEIVPIIPMLYSILTMPFSFLSQAFNLTLFVGTPYEVHIGSIILIILSILILLFFARLIIKVIK